MDQDLMDLYQEVILDHNKNPRNWGAVAEPTGRAEGKNPLCGDQFTVTVKVAGDTVAEVCFEGSGCAISKASASTMTEAVRGKSRAEVEKIFEGFRNLVTGKEPPEDAPALGKLEVFSGVGEFPMRVKCATLSWHALVAALAGDRAEVSTE